MFAGSMLDGLHSTVTSGGAEPSSAGAMAATTRPSCAGCHSEGVPPPKKIDVNPAAAWFRKRLT